MRTDARQVEPMHFTMAPRKTACGLDIRNCRSSRQADLCTCVVCQQRIIVEVVDRARAVRRPPVVPPGMAVGPDPPPTVVLKDLFQASKG